MVPLNYMLRAEALRPIVKPSETADRLCASGAARQDEGKGPDIIAHCPSSTTGPQAAARKDWLVDENGRTVSLTVRRNRGSNSGLFCHLERVVDFDAEVSDCALKFGLAKQQLYGPEVFCPAINQRCFGPTHRVRAVRRVVESN